MTKRSRTEWDIFQLKMARHYSTMSRDPSTRVGAVVTTSDSKYVLGMGYNGFPPDIPDTDDLLLNRTKKYALMVHAENNALNQALKIRGATGKVTLFVYPFLPCSDCARMIRDYRTLYDLDVTRIVTLDYTPERWKDDFHKSATDLAEQGVEVVKYNQILLAEPVTYDYQP